MIYKNTRVLSVAAFSFLFAYLLTFLFEGQVLYSIIEAYGAQTHIYIFSAILAHLAGLFSCGYFIRTQRGAKLAMTGVMAVCLVSSVPFFFAPSVLWLAGLIIAGFFGGWAVAAWGYFLKACTPKNERIKTCADVLIFSNLIMIAVNVVAMNVSHDVGLTLSMLCLIIGAVLTWLLPAGPVQEPQYESGGKSFTNIKKPMLVLFLFVAILTIDSGLMYQVINPAFGHLRGLVSWYWAVPYIAALAFMRNLPIRNRIQRSLFLYVGMGMIMAAFITFMLLVRGTSDYLVVNTLMLGACGIFDLFWWSILGEMLDYTSNPVRVFGAGLSANVLGVLLGDVLGAGITSVGFSEAEVAVIALTVVCITLVILPPLNRQLVLLLKNHAYLDAYDRMDKEQREEIICQIKLKASLTEREKEVLQLILAGKSNKEISEVLFITESTVKTHVRNIFSKYDVGSRAELISDILKNKSES